MGSWMVTAPVVLAAVLGLSGWAKWRDRRSTRSVLTLLRFPRWVINGPLPIVLPAVEVVIAVALLAASPGRMMTVAGVAVSALMACYLAVVCWGMSLSPRPRCGCFGRIGDHRLTWRTVARNVLLVALGVVAALIGVAEESTVTLLADARPQDWGWLLSSVTGGLVIWLVVGRPAGVGPARSTRSTIAATRGLPPGSPDPTDYVRTSIPLGTLQRSGGQHVSLPELARRRAVVLIAVDPRDPGATARVSSGLHVWRDRLRPTADVCAMVSPAPDRVVDLPDISPDQLMDHGRQVWQALGLSQESVQAVLLGADGLMAGGPVSGVEGIDEFVADVFRELVDAGVMPTRQPTGFEVHG